MHIASKVRQSGAPAPQKHVSRPASPPPSNPLVRELLRGLTSIGVSPKSIICKAGLAAHSANLLQGAPVSLTPSEFTNFYSEAITLLERHSSRATGSRPIAKHQGDMMCYCAVSSATLQAAIDLACSFGRLLVEQISDKELEVAGDLAIFRVNSRRFPSLASLLSDLTALAYFHSLFEWLIGDDLDLIEIRLTYGKLIDEAAVTDVFTCPVHYGADCNALVFPSRFLSRAVSRTSADLTPLLKNRPFGRTPRSTARTSVAQSITAILDAALMRGGDLPSLGAIANQMRQGVATVRRRLAQEDTTFRAIKQASRLRHANRLLAETRLTLGEIAGMIGYSDVASFNYAYKGWSGQSLSSYRRSIQPR